MTTLTESLASSLSSQEQKVVSMLGKGHPAVVVASTLGVSESRISQIVSSPGVSEEIARLKYEALHKYSSLDETYDLLEEKAQEKLKKSLPLLHKPMEIIKVLQILNSAKRRSMSPTDESTQGGEIVRLSVPASFKGKFAIAFDSENRATRAGDQELLTASLSQLPALASSMEKQNDSVPEVQVREDEPSTQRLGYKGSKFRPEDF